jgi:hypothetical protein
VAETATKASPSRSLPSLPPMVRVTEARRSRRKPAAYLIGPADPVKRRRNHLTIQFIFGASAACELPSSPISFTIEPLCRTAACCSWPVSFSPPNALPISVREGPMFTLAMPQSEGTYCHESFRLKHVESEDRGGQPRTDGNCLIQLGERRTYALERGET